MLLRDLLFSFSLSMLAAQAGAAPAPLAEPAAAPARLERAVLPTRLIAAQQDQEQDKDKAAAAAGADQDGLPVVLLVLALLLIRGRGQRSSAAPWQAIPVEQDDAAPAAPRPATPQPATTSSTTCRLPSSCSASTVPG